jgi:uncharacterized membrane protein YhaH (DUF805 family)
VLSIHSTGTCVVVVIELDDDTALGELILLLSELELEAADPAFVLRTFLELATAAESDLDAEADVDDGVSGGCEVGPSNLSYVAVPSLCMVYAPGTYISLPSFVVRHLHCVLLSLLPLLLSLVSLVGQRPMLVFYLISLLVFLSFFHAIFI